MLSFLWEEACPVRQGEGSIAVSLRAWGLASELSRLNGEPALPVDGSGLTHCPKGERDPASPSFEGAQRCCCPQAWPGHRAGSQGESPSPARLPTPSSAVGDPHHAGFSKARTRPSKSQSAFKIPSLTSGSCFLACEMETINT